MSALSNTEVPTQRPPLMIRLWRAVQAWFATYNDHPPVTTQAQLRAAIDRDYNCGCGGYCQRCNKAFMDANRFAN